ncbi:MAG: phosphate/phosphite/phosphonate ABC transporter substrate-binding protein [Deltaproteobacteria bacterium]|nr:phosphate/phosphite/phosphonate ABC transporter substrate-binding protein [Deltaproteobacteria bacterium]
MNAKLNAVLFPLLVALVIFLPGNAISEEYIIAVLANRGLTVAEKEWNPTAEYLSAQVGHSFSVVPMDDTALYNSVKNGKVDFFYTNSAMYVELSKLHNARAIATLINRHKDNPLEEWGSAIIVKRESPVKTLADFRGKDFICRGLTAFGGWLMAKRSFIESGLDPEREFKSLRSTPTHDNVVYAVYNGAADGGSVRTGTLEKMAADGKIKIEDFRVIQQVQDGFPLAHSTKLYPEYPMAACSHVPDSLADAVAEALTALSPSQPAAAAAKITGWKKPADYSPVTECLIIVQHGPYAGMDLPNRESESVKMPRKGGVAKRKARE